MFALGDADTDLNSDPAFASGTDPYLNAIRAISVPMGLLRQQIDAVLQNIANADAVVSDSDLNALQANIQQMSAYASALPAAIAAFRASPSYQADAATAAQLNNWLAFVMAWAGSSIAAIGQLPSDLAAYLQQQLQNIANAAGNAANTAAWAAVKAVAPLAIGALGLLLLLQQGEKTRTFRKYVA